MVTYYLVLPLYQWERWSTIVIVHSKSIFLQYQYLPVMIRDAPDNPAFFDIRYPAGYQIGQPDIQ
jgi:hypothetical protein